MAHLINVKQFPTLDEMLGLPEVIKDILNDLLEIELSGTYTPKQKHKLETELKNVQDRLCEFYN